MMTPDRLHTCFWNALLRAVVIFAGAASLLIAGTVDEAADHLTVFLAVSLSVISFQSVPPHCGPGVSTRATAGLANAATTAISAAAADRTNRIFWPPGSIRSVPQRTKYPSAARRHRVTLERVTPLAAAPHRGR